MSTGRHGGARGVRAFARIGAAVVTAASVVTFGLEVLPPSPDAAAAPTSVAVPVVASPATLDAPTTVIHPTAPDVPKGFVDGKSVEDISQRTDRDTVYVNPDGTRTVKLSSAPVRFKDAAGAWQDIDSSVIPDPASPGAFRSAANSWTVRFAPLPVGVALQTADGTQTMAPVGGSAVATPTAGPGPNQVTYHDVWKNADLRYSVFADRVEEEVVLTGPPDRSTFQFATDRPYAPSAVATPPVVVPGSPSFKQSAKATTGLTSGAPTSTGLAPATRGASFNPPLVRDGNGKPLDAAAPTLSAAPVGASPGVAVGVDPSWLGSLKATDFPVSIDPSWSVGASGSQCYKSDGYSASNCGLQIGNSLSGPGGGDTNWRSLIYFDYSPLLGTTVLSTDLQFAWLSAGTTNSYPAYAAWASDFSYSGAIPNNQYLATAPAATTIDFNDPNLTAKLNYFIGQNFTAAWWGFAGYEAQGLYTYKQFVVGQMSVTYDHAPGAPAATSPAASSVLTNANTSFTTSGASDPDAGDTLVYQFQVATGADGMTGRLATSQWGPATWTLPPGTFPDGGTYSWIVRARDNWGVMGPWSAAQQFRIDYGLGQRKTQPYDQLGGASVNLANGNLTLEASGPSFPTVGGPVGVNFTYNSATPVIHGLWGDYATDPNHNHTRDTGEPIELHEPPRESCRLHSLRGWSHVRSIEALPAGVA